MFLPWLMEFLGPTHLEAFLTRLEGDRPGPDHPYLAGIRATIIPVPCLELGASRVAMMGGEGRPVDWDTVGDALTGRNENEPDGPGNQLASLDCRLTIPWKVQPFQLYGEWGGEDMAGMFFSRNALLAGLYLPRLGPSGWLDLRLEYADTTLPRRRHHDRVWYVHTNYDYTYEGSIIGHHAGTDAQDLYAELGLYARAELRFWLAADRERRELSLAHPAERAEYSLGAEWAPWDRLTISVCFTREEIQNLDFLPGEERAGSRVCAGVTWTF